MPIQTIPDEIHNAFAGPMLMDKLSLDDLVKRDSIFLYLNNTNVRIGSAVVSIEKEADQSRWIVSQNFEITEKEKKQSIRLRSIVDTQLQTHLYEERLNVEDEEIFSVTVVLNEEGAEYIATEKRDGVEFQTHSFKSQHSYPILFPGSLYLFQVALLMASKENSGLDRPFEFLFFHQKSIRRILVSSRKVSSYLGVAVRVRGADLSQVSLMKETLFVVSDNALATDRFTDNFEVRSSKYSEEWNETNVYSNILDDVELSSYFKENKGTLSNRLQKYIEENGDLKDILSDYMKLLLHHKPKDVFSFTIDYFSPEKREKANK